MFHIYNIDDYHAIHEIHRPDTVSTSAAKHFATCVAKPIIESPLYHLFLIIYQFTIHQMLMYGEFAGI